MATVWVLEDTLVSRPPGAAVPITVPLTHFDVFWLNIPPVQRLFFYALPDLTTVHFTSSIVPALKSSLSLTLQHFFPISGRLIVSWPSQLPYIRCADGDSVSVAACETDMDFDHLAGDGARSFAQVQALVPRIAPPHNGDKDGREESTLIAVQLTVFPKSGFSIGVTYSHVAADGRAMVHFIKSWASICRSGGDPNCIRDSLPVHIRDLISDPGNKLASINVEVSLSTGGPHLPNISTETLRYTFVIGSLKIKELKTWVTKRYTQDQQQHPPLRVSTFMVTCALVWVCLLQVEQETRTNDDGDETVWKHFFFLADFRERLNLPGNYFGNCLRSCQAAANRADLVGEDGVYQAAKAIGMKIEEAVKEGMKGAEEWRKRGSKIYATGRPITIAGSPKFRLYDTDFGWGGPQKAEHAHIGSFYCITIAESRSEVGAVEFGLALSAREIERFVGKMEL